MSIIINILCAVFGAVAALVTYIIVRRILLKGQKEEIIKKAEIEAEGIKKEKIYQAALMDPHLQSELSIDDIISLCDDLIVAHEGWLPQYK